MVRSLKTYIAFNLTVNGFGRINVVEVGRNHFFVDGLDPFGEEGDTTKEAISDFIINLTKDRLPEPFIITKGECCLLPAHDISRFNLDPNKPYFFCEP